MVWMNRAPKAVEVLEAAQIQYVLIAVVDGVAALSGDKPLEQVADSSWCAWDRTLLQMREDLSSFNVCGHASGSLLTSQQAWPTRTQEFHARLQAGRAFRKHTGPIPAGFLTYRNNVARLQDEPYIAV